MLMRSIKRGREEKHYFFGSRNCSPVWFVDSDVRIMYGMGLLKLMKSSPLGVICTHGRCYLLLLLNIIIIKKKNL